MVRCALIAHQMESERRCKPTSTNHKQHNNKKRRTCSHEIERQSSQPRNQFHLVTRTIQSKVRVCVQDIIISEPNVSPAAPHRNASVRTLSGCVRSPKIGESNRRHARASSTLGCTRTRPGRLVKYWLGNAGACDSGVGMSYKWPSNETYRSTGR